MGGENLHGFGSLRESSFKELDLSLGTQALSKMFFSYKKSVRNVRGGASKSLQKGDKFHQRQETPSWLCSWECVDGIYSFGCLPDTFLCWELSSTKPPGAAGGSCCPPSPPAPVQSVLPRGCWRQGCAQLLDLAVGLHSLPLRVLFWGQPGAFPLLLVL